MELLYFILGIIFVTYVIPLLDGISAWFLTWVEAKKAKQSEIISQTNIKIRQAAASAEEDPPSRPIGFRMPNSEDYDEEENEDEV